MSSIFAEIRHFFKYLKCALRFFISFRTIHRWYFYYHMKTNAFPAKSNLYYLKFQVWSCSDAKAVLLTIIYTARIHFWQYPPVFFFWYTRSLFNSFALWRFIALTLSCNHKIAAFSGRNLHVFLDAAVIIGYNRDNYPGKDLTVWKGGSAHAKHHTVSAYAARLRL